MDLGSTTAAGSAGAANPRASRENTQAYDAKMNYTVSGRPLDFSFMKIDNIASKCLSLNFLPSSSTSAIIFH